MTEIKTFQVGIMSTNCYLITDKDTNEMAIVDPGAYSSVITDTSNAGAGNLKMILLTHGHYDHIGGVSDFLRDFPNAKVYIGEKDKICLTNDEYNLSIKMFRRRFQHFSADILCDGEILRLGNTEIKFMETPGHTAGSGCYIFDDKIMSGDTLFCESCGRTDFPGSSSIDIIKSLRILSQLEQDYTVYPGHDCSTTLSHEKKYNPYMRTNYEDIY